MWNLLTKLSFDVSMRKSITSRPCGGFKSLWIDRDSNTLMIRLLWVWAIVTLIYNQDTLIDGILSRPGGYELWLFPLHCLLNNSRRHEVGHQVSDQHQNSSDRHLFSSSFFPTIMLCGFVWPLEGMPYPWLRFVIQCCCWCPIAPPMAKVVFKPKALHAGFQGDCVVSSTDRRDAGHIYVTIYCFIILDKSHHQLWRF